jgi:hypothetical protein
MRLVKEVEKTESQGIQRRAQQTQQLVLGNTSGANMFGSLAGERLIESVIRPPPHSPQEQEAGSLCDVLLVFRRRPSRWLSGSKPIEMLRQLSGGLRPPAFEPGIRGHPAIVTPVDKERAVVDPLHHICTTSESL